MKLTTNGLHEVGGGRVTEEGRGLCRIDLDGMPPVSLEDAFAYDVSLLCGPRGNVLSDSR